MQTSPELQARAITPCLGFLSADGVQQANSATRGLPMGAAAMAFYDLDAPFAPHPKNPSWANRTASSFLADMVRCCSIRCSSHRLCGVVG